MQVQTITNQTNFKGIRLSNSDFNETRRIATCLKCSGLDCLGYKKMYCNNNFKDKIKAAQMVRNLSGFVEREFGVILFPWSKEAYIMASPAYEQFIFPVVKQFDEGATINLMM